MPIALLCRLPLIAELLCILTMAVTAPMDSSGPDTPPQASSESGGGAEDDPAPAPISDAEKITDLERTIHNQQTRLEQLEAELAKPSNEYSEAEQAFRQLDQELEQSRERLAELTQAGMKQQAAELERDIKAVELQWQLAKARFDLAIEERKTLREEIATIKLKLKKDRDELAELSGTAEPAPEPEDQNASEPDQPRDRSDATPDMSDEPSSEKNDASEEESDESDEELMQAEADAKEKEEQADEATRQAAEVAARIADLVKIIGHEQKSLSLARQKADLAITTRQALEQELAKKQAEGADAPELDELRSGITEANARYARARLEVNESTDRLNESRSELSGLQQEQILALQAAEKSRLEAEAAKEVVDDLRNPFAPRNLLRWLLEHAPRVILYVFAMFAMVQAAKVFSNRVIRLMAGAGGRGTTAERENRAKTLVGVFQNAASVTIFIGGTLVILDELGAKVSVLVGGVAVVGLAVAFGAQNLIKDYFYGFVMLLENQYMLNDNVKIGELTGQVERITLRMTVLRDPNGVVHFIPNGQINCVSNETHGWSRAAFEIAVSYNENVDRCIAALQELARQMRQDPAFGPMIIEEPTVPAVDQLADSAVILKFFIKTRPHQQGAVRRELLRRIKNRFDELNIEIPFPQRTVHHRYEASEPGERRDCVGGVPPASAFKSFKQTA